MTTTAQPTPKTWKPPPPPAEPAKPARAVPAFVPFPTHALAAPLRPFVREAAVSIGCDEAYVAVPALAATAAAIGNTRQVRLKRGWAEPAIVWAALVGGSGNRKSPPFRAAMRPLVDAELEHREAHNRAVARRAGLPPDQRDAEPEPVLTRILTEDITIESVAHLLLENPRGVINARDEIEDWFQALTRYKGKAGGTDRARWLKLSNADTLTVDRKTGEPHLRHLFVPIAACSIVGTIQLGVLSSALDALARESGLAARLLLAWPDYVKAYWTDAEVDPATEAGYADLVKRLLALTMTATRVGRPAAHVLDLGREAKEVWVPWYNQIQDRKADATQERRAVLAKLEGYAARFALVYHVSAETAAGRDALSPVGPEAVRAGIQLSDWFAWEAERIYQVLGEDDAARGHRELADWVRLRGGRCTARDLQRARGTTFPTADLAEAALEVLVQGGVGVWEQAKPSQKGGHTPRVFVLKNDTDTRDTRPPDGQERQPGWDDD